MLKTYWVKNPFWLQFIYPKGLVWKKDAQQQEGQPIVYLTFDDGPHPTITPFVLDLLDKYNAKATFFCIGDNVRKYPYTFNQIIARGHAIGNHTYNHLNGWKTSREAYTANIEKAAALIPSKLFRPPYGRITFRQAKAIKQLHPNWQICMWDVISGDFDASITPAQCTANVIDNISPGSLVVFHDSEKAFGRLEGVLEEVLAFCREKGWGMESL